MGVSAEQGPKVFYGQRPPLGNASNNPDAGAGMVYGGWGLIDPRVGYNVTALGSIGWYGTNPTVVVDQVPSQLSTVAIAAAQVPVAGTALTLVSTTGAGITVMASSFLSYGSGNTIAAGSLAIDGLPGYINGGVVLPATGNARLRWYDPTKAIARNVQIASVGDDHLATFTVSGADLYGYPQTEAITGANAGTAVGAKSFKFIYSITPSGTLSGANVSVGQGDVYGFPLFVGNFFYSTIFWNSALITATTGFTAGDTTSPATSTTGDVRGTYAVQSASDGTKRLQMAVDLSIARIGAASNMTVAMFGVTPA